MSQQQYLIQLERPGQKLSMKKVREIFFGTGVKLDEGYGPINVNPARGRYVVRGWTTPDGRKRAEQIPGVSFFGDAKITPATVGGR